MNSAEFTKKTWIDPLVALLQGSYSSVNSRPACVRTYIGSSSRNGLPLITLTTAECACVRTPDWVICEDRWGSLRKGKIEEGQILVLLSVESVLATLPPHVDIKLEAADEFPVSLWDLSGTCTFLLQFQCKIDKLLLVFGQWIWRILCLVLRIITFW